MPVVIIKSCYDGDTCLTVSGEIIRLACIDAPELRGTRADPIAAKASRAYLQSLVVGAEVGIRRITTDRHGRTIAELFIGGSNIQQLLVAEGAAEISWKFANQCRWTL